MLLLKFIYSERSQTMTKSPSWLDVYVLSEIQMWPLIAYERYVWTMYMNLPYGYESIFFIDFSSCMIEYVKFRYCEKATKFVKNLPEFFFIYLVTSK